MPFIKRSRQFAGTGGSVACELIQMMSGGPWERSRQFRCPLAIAGVRCQGTAARVIADLDDFFPIGIVRADPTVAAVSPKPAADLDDFLTFRIIRGEITAAFLHRAADLHDLVALAIVL